ncbi:hypothetical protein MASR2M78_08550 [Treponema sp.]
MSVIAPVPDDIVAPSAEDKDAFARFAVRLIVPVVPAETASVSAKFPVAVRLRLLPAPVESPVRS